MAYEIGYRRPPESGRFKKGKSGNPKGRPKGSTNFLTILERELGQSIVVNENGKKKTITRMQAMVKRIVAGALQGDLKAGPSPERSRHVSVLDPQRQTDYVLDLLGLNSRRKAS